MPLSENSPSSNRSAGWLTAESMLPFAITVFRETKCWNVSVEHFYSRQDISPGKTVAQFLFILKKLVQSYLDFSIFEASTITWYRNASVQIHNLLTVYYFGLLYSMPVTFIGTGSSLASQPKSATSGHLFLSKPGADLRVSFDILRMNFLS